LGADMRSLAGQSPEELGQTIDKYSNITPADDYPRPAERRYSSPRAPQKNLWGNYWPNTVPQIAPPGAAPLVKAISAGADPVAMQRLIEIPKGESPAKILKEQNEVTAKNLNTSLNTAFAPFLASMGGLQKDRDYSGYAALGTELGALYVRDGMKESEAAAKAFNDLVGSRYDFRDTYRIPKAPQINPDEGRGGVYQPTRRV